MLPLDPDNGARLLSKSSFGFVHRRWLPHQISAGTISRTFGAILLILPWSLAQTLCSRFLIIVLAQREKILEANRPYVFPTCRKRPEDTEYSSDYGACTQRP